MKLNKYNPFKMWGNYIGLIFVIIGYFSEAMVQGVFCPRLNHIISQEGAIVCGGHHAIRMSIFGLPFMPYYIFYPLMALIFFLIGWGINALIIFIRDKKGGNQQ